MSQQNIDFGTFPDDPAADAIRTAFQKVQTNFEQLFNTSNAIGAVTSVNRTSGAGITVNQPTGAVVISANIACLQVSTSSLKVGRGTDNTQNFVTITSSAQKLNIDINPVQVLSNYFANSTNGMASFNGTLTGSSNAQPNITSVGTLTSLGVSGAALFEGSNTYISDLGNFHIPGGSDGQGIQTDGAGNLYWGASTQLSNGTSNINIPVVDSNINISVAGNANVVVITGTGANITGTANITGNATVGNLGFGTGIVTGTGNITAGFFLGNGSQLTGIIATSGTANILSNGTSNVNIPTINGNITIGSAGIGNVVVITSTGMNVTGTANISGNANVGNLGTSGNITAGNLIGPHANGTSNVSIPSVNGNVNVVSAGNTTLVVTGTGANITGTANISGNATVGNLGTAQVLATANVTAPQLISNIATGTSPLVVTSTTQVANLNVATAGLATYATTANAVAGANVSGAVSFATTANAVAGANVIGAVSFATTASTANAVAGANVIGQVANALVAGTVYTNAQPNITSVGSLATLIVTGNANVGNLGTVGNISAGFFLGNGSQLTGITATSGTANSLANGTSNVNIPTINGNITIGSAGIGNVVVITSTGMNVAGTTNISGNANVGNIGAATAIITTGNITTINSGLIQNSTSNITLASAGNVSTFIGGNVTAQLVVTATGANIAGTANITGNANVGNLGATSGVFTETLSVTGNANVGNLGAATAIISTGNITIINSGLIKNSTSNITLAAGANVSTFIGGNATAQFVVTATGANIPGTLNVVGNANLGNLGVSGIITTTGNITTINSSLMQNGNSNVVITANGNVTITATSNAAFKVTATGANITGTANISGNLSAANAILGNLATANYVTVSSNVSANNISISGSGNISGANVISAITFQGNFSGGMSNGTSNVNIPAINGNVNISSAGNANVLVVLGTGVRITGIATIIGNASIGNVGVSGILSVTSNANVGNLGTAGQIISTIGTGTAPPFTVLSSDRVANLNVDYANVSDYSTVTTAAAGTVYPVFVYGNSTANYEIASNANLSFNAGTGNLSTTLLSVTSNANVGNLGTARVIATTSITSPQLISNVVTGTAPFVVTSTTIVSNLTASRANVSDYGAVTAQTTGTYYPTFINGSSTGNYQLASNSSISANLANGSLTATTFIGNIGVLSNGTSNVNIPAVNGNVNVSSAGNANIVVVTGTGTIINGTAGIIPKTTPTVVTSPQFTIGESTANTGYQMRLSYINDPLYGYMSAIQSVSGLSTPAQLMLNPSGGNVGINIANTNAKLDVAGSGRFLAAAAGANGAVVLRQNSSDTAGAYIQWTNYASSSQTGYIVVDITNNMSLGTANIARVFIDRNGNVGIANTVPSHTLSVTGTANISGNANVGNLGFGTGEITGTGNITAGFFLGNGSLLTGLSGSSIISNGNSNVRIATANGNVTIAAVGNATMTITGTGANVTGTANISGNVIVGNLIGPHANGTSNVSIPAVNGNVNIVSAGNTTLTITGTGANVTGTLNASGNISGANVQVTGYSIRSNAVHIIAAGSTQGTATLLSKEINGVDSVASGAGVRLPTLVQGMSLIITNTSANSLKVYPTFGDSIGYLGINNAAYTQLSNTTLQYVAVYVDTWYIVGAP